MNEETSRVNRLRTTLPGQLLGLRVPLFLLVALLTFSYVVWRVYALANAPVPASAVCSKLDTAKNPHIDQATIDKINQLQDNSVSVRALFDQARQNPFQE